MARGLVRFQRLFGRPAFSVQILALAFRFHPRDAVLVPALFVFRFHRVLAQVLAFPDFSVHGLNKTDFIVTFMQDSRRLQPPFFTFEVALTPLGKLFHPIPVSEASVRWGEITKLLLSALITRNRWSLATAGYALIHQRLESTSALLLLLIKRNN
ncbi:hypothetical protein F511_17262 [Dorcoceras hygrometricum]|uniref:Uncharacterized protein n=1 Tax=Dorcoceras hygrometricum TaxID=472368 RepID=A0A2Z7B2I4_9LAMI|nr:hypothetical protein F511_17262 [Dorcoceras hygrometricum]